MKNHKNRNSKEHRQKKKKTSHFPIHTFRPDIEILPGDELIAEGKVENTSRLVQLAHSNVPKFYPVLINNPLLDPESRYSVVLGILNTPNHVISLRRKYDFLSESSEIHYYRDERKSKLSNFIKSLSSESQDLLLRAAQRRIEEIKRLPDLNYEDNREIREQIDFIYRMGVFSLPTSLESYSQLFWEVARNVVISEAQEKNSAPIKHINDVTHSKLTAIWKIQNIEGVGIAAFYNSKSHPVIIASLYYARIRMRFSLNAYPEFVKNVHAFSNEYSSFLQLAREREAELRRLEEIKAARREEIRQEKLEAEKRRIAEKEEIERVRRETLLKYPSSGGYSGIGGGNPWGPSNNSRHLKGG